MIKLEEKGLSMHKASLFPCAVLSSMCVCVSLWARSYCIITTCVFVTASAGAGVEQPVATPAVLLVPFFCVPPMRDHLPPTTTPEVGLPTLLPHTLLHRQWKRGAQMARLMTAVGCCDMKGVDEYWRWKKVYKQGYPIIAYSLSLMMCLYWSTYGFKVIYIHGLKYLHSVRRLVFKIIFFAFSE